MKNYFKNIRSIFIWSVLLLFSFNLLAQGSATGYLYVYPSDPSAYPNQQGSSSNPTLQSLFQQYQVYSYAKSFPSSVGLQLQNAYEILLNGNEHDLKSALESTGLFSLVEREPAMEAVSNPIIDCPEPCSNPQSVTDPNTQYELSLPGYLCAWNITQGDPNVVVAIVDADFDLDNPDLQGNMLYKTAQGGACGLHGTKVATTIVGTLNNGYGIAGVAPGVKTVGYTVLNTSPNGCGCGTSNGVWPVVWQAYLDGRRIINVSWTGVGSPSSGTVTEAVREMVENGTLLVVAAGNGDPGSQEHSAYYDIPGVLNVSSISSDGTLHEWVTYNQGVDLCAPGDAVGSIPFSCGGMMYNVNWGTSLSAPNAAGAAALILSVNPCLKPTEIENILKTTTCPIENPTVIDIYTNMSHDELYRDRLS